MGKKNLVPSAVVAAGLAAAAATAEQGAVADVPVTAPRVPMAEPEGGWPADEFSGMSGRFVRDPFTGVRSRAPDEGAAT